MHVSGLTLAWPQPRQTAPEKHGGAVIAEMNKHVT